ncbi:MAG: hypothetical protein A2X86_13330 [Bdellovibrionales bacterium GWA2_49_15]|nr:MAG: hypothetical protein A2X86_13330 [Bdellovibrionales bacterium GWA2_49_15]HAZ13507.1 hypothetical protein [Bdellovibrionales bacterium]
MKSLAMIKSLLVVVTFLVGLGAAPVTFSEDIYEPDPSDDPSSEVGSGGNTSIEEIKPLPSEFVLKAKDDIRDGIYDMQLGLAASLFDSITNQTLFDYGDDVYNVAISVKRDVYNNQDIMDSYTVVDTMRLPFRLNLFNPPRVPLGPVSLKARLSTQFQLSMMNVRTVYPSELRHLPRPTINEEELRQVDLTALTANSATSNPEEDEVLFDDDKVEAESLGQKIKRFFKGDFKNPETKARWSKFYNILAHPFRMPVTQKNFQKMGVGEIFSYGLEGLIELDLEAAFSIAALPGFDSFNVGVSSSTYLKGNYRVSILKEDTKNVLVKLNRVKSRGTAFSFGAHEDLVLFEGVTILGAKVAKITESVIPFQLTVAKNYAHSFDVAYRYDLSNPDALEAYGDALGGRFKLSHELSKRENSGVRWAYNRDQREHSTVKQYRMKLSFLFERTHQSSNRHTVMVITDGEGTHHIYKGEAHNGRSWDTLWGPSEVKNYSFKFLVDKAKYYTSNQGAALTFTGTLGDTHTTLKELNSYMRQVSEATGLVDLFPTIQKDYPRKLCLSQVNSKQNEQLVERATKKCEKIKPSALGTSRFFYRIGFNKTTIQTFMNTASTSYWTILEKAFGIKAGRWSTTGKRTWYNIQNAPLALLNLPLALVDVTILRAARLYHAERFAKYWRKLKNVRSLDEMSQNFSKMLTTSLFSTEFLKIIKIAAPTEDFEYYVDARSDLTFGQISRIGDSQVLTDQEFERRMRQIDFEVPSNHVLYDPESLITGLDIKKISDGELELTFDLSHAPKYFYLSLERSGIFKGYKRLASVFMVNSADLSRLKKGHNSFKLLLNSQDAVAKTLATHLLKGGSFTLKGSIMRPGQTWGPLSIIRKTIEKPEKPEVPQKKP